MVISPIWTITLYIVVGCLGLEVSSHPRLPAYVPLTNLMLSPLLSMIAFVVLAFNIGTLHQYYSYIFMHSISRGTTYVICVPGIGSNSYSSSLLISIWFYFCGQSCGVCGQFCGYCGRFWICAFCGCLWGVCGDGHKILHKSTFGEFRPQNPPYLASLATFILKMTILCPE